MKQISIRTTGILIRLIVMLVLILEQAACSKKPRSTLAPLTENEQVVITFADFRAFQPQYEALIAEFQAQHLSITVHFVPIDTEAGGATLDHQRLASLADVLNLPILPEGSDSYNYLDLKPLQESDVSFVPDAFWPGSLDGCRVDGRMIGLPLDIQVSLILFDGAAFDAAGVPRPAAGWNWQDFENAARLLTEHQGNQTTRYGFVDQGNPLALLAPLVSATQAKSNGEFDPVTLAKALDWYVSLVREGVIPAIPQTGGALETKDLIVDRQAAMWLGSLSSLSERRLVLGDAIGAAPFPVAADGSISQTTPAWAKCAVVSAGTAHPQESWAWLKFLATHPAPITDPMAVPSFMAVAEENGSWKDLDAQTVTAVRYALNHAWYGANASEQFNAIGQALTQAMAGKAPLAETLASIQGGASASPPPTPNAAPLAVATPEPTATPVTLSDNVVVVKYFVNPIYEPNLEVLKPLAKAFTQEHPEITIQLVDDQSAFQDKGFNFDQVAQQFDCFAFGLVAGGSMAAELYSLEPLIEADPDGEKLLDDLPADLLAIDRANGELYALPVSSQPDVMYYNKTLLSKMGLQPPALDWTLDNFWTLASAATAKDIYGLIPLDGRGFLDFLLTARGVQLYDLTSETPMINFDAPETLSIVSMLADMAKNGVIPPINGLDNAAQRYEWAQEGHAVMWTDLAGMDYQRSSSPGGADFEVGVAPMPAIGKPLKPAYNGVSLYISRQAKNPTACWQWIKYLSAQPDAFLGIPARRSVLASDKMESTIGSDLAAAYRAVMAQPRQELLDYEERYPSAPLYLWWSDTLASVFKGVPPAQALAELQTKAQAYLDCITIAENPQNEETWMVCAKQADPEFVLPQDRPTINR